MLRTARCVAVLAAIATLSATAALSGCSSDGGGGRLSKRDFIRSAGEICTDANKKIRAIGSPDLTNPQTTTGAIRRLVALQRKELGDLRGLEPPGIDQPAIKKWLGLVDKALREANAALAALERGDRKGVNDANARGGEAQRGADDVARDYGVNRCVSRAETPPPAAAP